MKAILNKFTGFRQTFYFLCLVYCNFTSKVSSFTQGTSVNLIAELVRCAKLNIFVQLIQASMRLIPIVCETVPSNIWGRRTLLTFILLRIDLVDVTVSDGFSVC